MLIFLFCRLEGHAARSTDQQLITALAMDHEIVGLKNKKKIFEYFC